MAMTVGLAEKELIGSARCVRCRGLMVVERGFESMVGTASSEVWLRRCVQCGDIIDPVILLNRRSQIGNDLPPEGKQ